MSPKGGVLVLFCSSTGAVWHVPCSCPAFASPGSDCFRPWQEQKKCYSREPEPALFHQPTPPSSSNVYVVRAAGSFPFWASWLVQGGLRRTFTKPKTHVELPANNMDL